ncbi:MAG: UDP-3-O-(3-hydroxymyristoyl)glucosamine N-acyltransferase [Hyphomicrobiaceae bacterium]
MHPGFFKVAGPFSVDQIAERIQARMVGDVDGSRLIAGLQPLVSASQADLAFFDNRRYADQLAVTSAGACVLAAKDIEIAPPPVIALEASKPYEAFARAMRLFYSDALRSKAAMATQPSTSVLIHPTAEIAEGADIEVGAVIGREAKIGRGTIVAAGAVVGYRTVLGDDCQVGAGAAVTHAIVGDGVIIHPGVRIGQDGFGFAMGSSGHLKVPQIGSVIIENDVEIGANSTIDRGTLADTRIGEGTKIDNLVQIAHNVIIGRHCVIVAQSGIAGSAELGDFVVMGAQSGVLGHVKVGAGAQIAGMAHVKDDVAPGARMGGTPARPFKDWAREVAALRALSQRRHSEN